MDILNKCENTPLITHVRLFKKTYNCLNWSQNTWQNFNQLHKLKK